jgi:hypothetical protein
VHLKGLARGEEANLLHRLRRNLPQLFARVRNPKAVQAQLVKHARKRREARVGKRYMEVVLRCLTGDFGVGGDDTKEDLRLQQAFRYQVIDVLEMAASSL